MSESESSTNDYINMDIDNVHYELLNEIDNIKNKLTSQEFKTIVDKLVKIKNIDKMIYNKSIILDIQSNILKTFISLPDGDNTINLAQLRPLEAVNYIAEFANIILNIENMTNEPDDDLRSTSREFIFKQLGTSYTGDYHRTILQMVTYERLKEIINLLEKLKLN